jgi:hypothetical protein
VAAGRYTSASVSAENFVEALFNNLSQATCVGARKSNSARAKTSGCLHPKVVAQKSSQSLCLKLKSLILAQIERWRHA